MVEEVNSNKSKIISVCDAADVIAARRSAKQMLSPLMIDERIGAEIELVVSELASNIVKHAGQGQIALSLEKKSGRERIQVEALDNGPGIASVEQAESDGYSTTGSLGYGLGTVCRLMDHVSIQDNRETSKGTHIICNRRLHKENPSLTPCPLDIGAATRPFPKMNKNGDAFVIKKWGASVLVGVIDGLGHGIFAQRAAQTARHTVENFYDLALKDIFLQVQRACRTTRGVVMALARFDCGLQQEQPLQATMRLSFASIGNIEARMFGPKEQVKFILRRGILGKNAPMPVVTEHSWSPENILALHSDGIKTRWGRKEMDRFVAEPATVIAQNLLRFLAKDDDDATVLVVKGKKINDRCLNSE